MTWGYYEVDKPFYVKEGESVAIGVRKDDGLVNDWVCIDDFSLEYLGDGDANKPDDFVSSVEEAVADGKATVVASVHRQRPARGRTEATRHLYP